MVKTSWAATKALADHMRPAVCMLRKHRNNVHFYTYGGHSQLYTL